MNHSFVAASAALFCLFASAPGYGRQPVPKSGRVGNGGFAYVCRDTNGQITLARLLDLWEAEGVSTWTKEDSIDAQLEAAMTKVKSISPNAAQSIGSTLKKFVATATYSNRALVPTDDAFPSYKPALGCGYEQVARYEQVISETGQSGVRIASEIYHSPFFSNSDRAALFFHEAAYFIDREINQATHSQRTRLIVAHLFSDSEIPNAVRLAIAATLVGEKRWDDVMNPKEKVPATIVAVPDPLRIPFEVQFSAVDGIHAYNLEEMTKAQKAAEYECKTTSWDSVQSESSIASTGWVKLADLVKAYVYDSSEDIIRIRGTFAALEVADPEFGSDGAQVVTSIYLECSSRNAKGKVQPVSYSEASFRIPDGESLYIRDDGSLQTSDGQTPLSPTVSLNTIKTGRNRGQDSKQMSEFIPQIVRSSSISNQVVE